MFEDRDGEDDDDDEDDEDDEDEAVEDDDEVEVIFGFLIKPASIRSRLEATVATLMLDGVRLRSEDLVAIHKDHYAEKC